MAIKKNAVFLKVIPEDTSKYLRLSVSKVKTFKSCKKKFYFQYKEKLPRKEWPHTNFGSFLHEVLERFETLILAGRTEPDNILMKECFSGALAGDIFEGNKNNPVVWEEKIDADQKKESFEILCSFLKRRAELKKEGKLPKVVQPEKEFHIEIGDILLIGFIDLLQIDPDGVLHVADYKTSKSKKYLQKDFMQLKTYAYALFLENPELDKVRASYVMLKHNFDLIETEFTREEVMSTCTKDFLKYAEEIESEKLYRSTVSPLCGYCDFVEQCEDGLEKLGRPSGKFGETTW